MKKSRTTLIVTLLSTLLAIPVAYGAINLKKKPAATITHNADDTVTVSESVDRLGTFLRTLADSFSLSEAVTGVASTVVQYLDEVGAYLTDKVSEIGERVFATVSEIGRWTSVSRSTPKLSRRSCPGGMSSMRASPA